MLLRQRNDLVNGARQLLRQAAGERKLQQSGTIFRNALPGHTDSGELVAPTVFSARRRRSGGTSDVKVAPGHLSRGV